MKRVLVIGAGGTVAQARSFRPVRVGPQLPPLDLDFFTRCDDLVAHSQPVAQAVRRLRRALAQAGTFADPWVPVPVSLEQQFADAYYEVARTRDRDVFEVFISLLDLYARVIEETTNWMAGRPRSGVIGRLLRLEIQRAAGNQLTVVTFNHDLVIENEVSRLPRATDTWCLSSLYGDVELNPIYSTNPDVFPHHTDECTHGLPLTVLKLHGSLNWVLRTRAADPELGTLFPAASARQRQVFVHNAIHSFHSGVRLRPVAAGRPWYLWPLVVPPIYDKQRVIGTRLFGAVWEQAREAIVATDHLTLVGYSLPDADVFARQMFRRAFSRNNALEEVSVVNPDAAVVAKLRAILAPRVMHVYADIESYLAHPTD